MVNKTGFVGRLDELDRLQHFANKGIASFIVVKGRRRIGKSRLIEEFSKSFKHYYKFEGLAPEDGVTIQDQIDEFSRQISRQFKTSKAKYEDWSDALWAVGERVQSGETLLFFDELSWMGDKDPTFLGKIKQLWDNQLKANNQLVFVVCSSASAWIEKNLLSSTAFVGRISLRLRLQELPLPMCNEFWPQNIAAFEKFKLLSVTGGIPKYLEEIDPKLSAEENIKRLCFMDGGLLVRDFEQIFSDLFLRESLFYKKIVKLLINGAKEQADIQADVCNDDDRQHYGRIPEYLWELEQAGFIQRDFTWNIKTGEDSKLSKYRLHDNYLRFYLKYIEKNLGKIDRGLYALKSLTSLANWNAMMGLQFENMVINNRDVIHRLLNLKPDEIVNANPFFQRKTQRMPGCQIDYLIQTKFGCLYVCEIKFSKNLIGVDVIEEVQQKIDRLKRPKGFSCRPVLIHVNGVTNDLLDADYFAEVINLGLLLESPEMSE